MSCWVPGDADGVGVSRRASCRYFRPAVTVLPLARRTWLPNRPTRGGATWPWEWRAARSRRRRRGWRRGVGFHVGAGVGPGDGGGAPSRDAGEGHGVGDEVVQGRVVVAVVDAADFAVGVHEGEQACCAGSGDFFAGATKTFMPAAVWANWRGRCSGNASGPPPPSILWRIP